MIDGDSMDPGTDGGELDGSDDDEVQLDGDDDLDGIAPAPGGGEFPPFDHERIRRAVREILVAIGENPDREGLAETPGRVARMYAELFSGLREDPGRHLNLTFEEGHDEMVMVKDMRVYSVCEHHLIPWMGTAHIAYIPNEDGRITGLSKLARVVDGFARRPQVQERLTTQIAETVEKVLEPRGVLVVVEAEHLCMSMRGVRKPGSVTITSAVRGLFRDCEATRSEGMSFILGHRR